MIAGLSWLTGFMFAYGLFEQHVLIAVLYGFITLLLAFWNIRES